MSSSSSNLCHIVGAGAIGQYIAHELAPAFSICLHTRFTTLKQIKLEDSQNNSHQLDLAEDDGKQIQLLIICTKSFEALKAFEQYQHRLKPSCIVICLFNGLGPQFEIELAHPNTWLATTTIAALKLKTNTIKHTGLGETFIGQSSNSVNSLFTQKIIKRLNWCISENIIQKLYLKLAINSLINPLTVIYNCKNGALLNNTAALNLMKALANEIEPLCKSVQIDLNAKDIFNISCAVAQKTSENYSSMHQDILNKRQSEIELINGYWQQLGTAAGLSTDYNSKILQQVKALSKY
ncbi:MAG: ketopantoate reductase family protein [Saccharospirillaceae bacterium]|nr:ketopantoate reductase family protein [Pseudomonadales bacterium]NRB81174.1 ketopantoate reductase family protein [Saccharospirillaceae bacterium]